VTRADDGRLGEVARLFLRLGTTAFGGPAAHIAMMHDEVVTRRRWVSEQEFLDMVGATNLIPGPNSTELAIHLGHRRARWRGLVVAGVCFIAPAALIVLALAWAYVRYGTTDVGEGVLYGIKPVVIAIVVQALLKLGRTAAKTPFLAAVGLAAVAAYLAGVNELVVLAAGAAIVVIVRAVARQRGGALNAIAVWPLLAGPIAPTGVPVDLATLFTTFLKIGAVLYGGGYVLLAFLRGDIVERLGWLTEQQLLDAISIGQVTPGPVFTTATFVGYVVAGILGAVLATVAIFLPSFVFVALLSRLVPWMRAHRFTADLLDGANVTALGLMAGVTAQLGREALVDALTIAIAAAAGLLLWRTRLNSVWLIAAGAGIGIAHSLV
jgi:chromate transporter